MTDAGTLPSTWIVSFQRKYPRLIDRRLNSHAVIEDVAHKLHLPERLELARR